ncbi:hypothetical protein AB0K60_35590 [Thermopolyspora sp. NPDC052614]|uniref:hypothetical protein n=1 Tax=Thermopolyspora sp. NPDC052614 TaxID=3155682 RepID=UPI0034395B60
MELDVIEARIAGLRTQVRQAVAAGDRERARWLRAELRAAERAWEEALEPEAESGPSSGPYAGPYEGPNFRPDAVPDAVPNGGPRSRLGAEGGGAVSRAPLLPVREQVHQALALLGVPTAARLIVAVHEAFFGGNVTAAQLSSLRRDEERSFRAAPYARPYYLCAALTADLLSPARGLLASSTWPMATRIIGPLSSRTGFLTSAIRIAEHIMRLREAGKDASPSAHTLLARMARTIPGAVEGYGAADPATVVAAAGAELAVHEPADRARRAAAAERAVQHLDAAAQLFGAGLRTAARTGRTA